jgi:hypothetical protein
MSNSLLSANGTKYPTLQIINPDFSLNQTAYEEHGPVYLGLQNIWATFLSYAKLLSAFVWMTTFGASSIVETLKKNKLARQARKEAAKQQSASGVSTPNIHHQYTDRLNVLQRSYKEVSAWWFGLSFVVGAVIIFAIVGAGQLFVPVWTVVVGLATGVVVVVPLGYLYAIWNYQVAIDDFNELMYGYMVQTKVGAGHHHPCGPSVYGSIAGDAWYRAQYMLQDQRIGHYMHIPPRTVFFSQIFGSILGIPINYGVIRWVLNNKFDYLSGRKTDPCISGLVKVSCRPTLWVFNMPSSGLSECLAKQYSAHYRMRSSSARSYLSCYSLYTEHSRSLRSNSICGTLLFSSRACRCSTVIFRLAISVHV